MFVVFFCPSELDSFALAKKKNCAPFSFSLVCRKTRDFQCSLALAASRVDNSSFVATREKAFRALSSAPNSVQALAQKRAMTCRILNLSFACTQLSLSARANFKKTGPSSRGGTLRRIISRTEVEQKKARERELQKKRETQKKKKSERSFSFFDSRIENESSFIFFA